MKKMKFKSNFSRFLSWLCFPFILVVLFAISFLLLFLQLNKSNSSSVNNPNTILESYLTDNFPENVDRYYQAEIDQPMENFFNSSAATSFFFSTAEHPSSEELISIMAEKLNELTSEHEYVSIAAIYTSASNKFVSSDTPSDIEDNVADSFLYNMIYKYNSNTLEKIQISGSKSNTFLFQFHQYIVISKDLTTINGVPYATMFWLITPDKFSSMIYDSNASIPYHLSIYDPYGNTIISNIKYTAEEQEQVTALLAGTAQTEFASGHSSFLYFSSDYMKLRYILKLELLTTQEEHSLLFTSGIVGAAILFIMLLLTVILFLIHGGTIKRIIKALNLDSCEDVEFGFLKSIRKQAELLKNENSIMKKVISATSSDVLAHLFANIIAGAEIEDKEAEILLANCGFDYHINDVYAVGILHQKTSDFIQASERYQILNILNATFNKFKEKNACNITAFLYDEKSFVIIASFPYGTSIAKGKGKINTLTQMIEESIALSRLPMIVSFGHMYNSLWDLSFSYNEAFKGMHYSMEQFMENLELSSEETEFITSSPADSTPAKAEADSAIIDQDSLIERRTYQIAQLISEDHLNQAINLVERVMKGIFQEGSIQAQREACKHLTSALTSRMMSYPFVNDMHLSDVYNDLSNRLSSDASSEELQEMVYQALQTLCQDFADAMQKQKNPYIVSAMEYIEENYNNPDLSLEEIAEKLNIAPNYLSTLFSKSLGKKLFEYVNEFRLEKSIQQLLCTNDSIQEISEKNGFGSSRNYIRIFKKYKETTPGVYRKQHLDAAANE